MKIPDMCPHGNVITIDCSTCTSKDIRKLDGCVVCDREIVSGKVCVVCKKRFPFWSIMFEIGLIKPKQKRFYHDCKIQEKRNNQFIFEKNDSYTRYQFCCGTCYCNFCNKWFVFFTDK